MLDVRELGSDLPIGAVKPELLPPIINRPEILSRFKQDNYVSIDCLRAGNRQGLSNWFAAEWVDHSRRDSVVTQEKHNQVPGYESLNISVYRPAFDRFCGYLTNDPRDAKPREILERLNRVAAQACLNRVRLVTKDELIRQGIA